MQESGFKDMEEYVPNRQNTVAQYIATRPILDICEEMVQMPGTWAAKRWWDNEGLELTLARVVAATREEEGGRGRDRGRGGGVARN